MTAEEITQEWLFDEAKELLESGQNVIMRGRGDSMNPCLRAGTDAVVLSPFMPDELRTGSIVLFTYRGRYLLHRIIGRRGDRLVIQGDGVRRGKELVPPDDVIAVVHTVIRPNGREISVHSRGARLYWQVWRRLRPFRRYLLWIWRKLPDAWTARLY
ncbi:MAG: S24/S26 family peptidase [Bacteroidales bacterium]|jgi:phage repressor protein C with HTH and peptisase S24 domain|nr:S24/S26 family peptidase [Bacteroidales bacterium]